MQRLMLAKIKVSGTPSVYSPASLLALPSPSPSDTNAIMSVLKAAFAQRERSEVSPVTALNPATVSVNLRAISFLPVKAGWEDVVFGEIIYQNSCCMLHK